MKYLLLVFGFLVFIISSNSVQAASIKLAPLKYQLDIPKDSTQVGAVDVSNPTDSVQRYSAVVQAFRQTNENGDIEFYNDTAIASGIVVDVNDFTLNPHQVARIFFSVNGSKLPKHGVYAAVLITALNNQPNTATNIATQVQGGTLLILDNGGGGQKKGEVASLNAPFWQFGKRLHGQVQYKNTGEGSDAIAFNPKVAVTAVPWGKVSEVDGPLVFVGNQRVIQFNKDGSYFGFLPLEVSDGTGGVTKIKWVFAITGIWIILVPLAFVLMLVASFFFYRHKMIIKSEDY